MLSLNTIKASARTAKTRKRVGRGDASGHGTYSTRGIKGQKARSGVSNLKRLGMKQQLLQTPKVRGFKSNKSKNQIINVKVINANFKNDELVNPIILLEKNLIKSSDKPVKILGKDKLTVKPKFENIKLSKNVEEQLNK